MIIFSPRLLVRSIQITVFPDEIGIAKRKEKLLEMELSQDDRRDEGSQESQGGLAGAYTNGGPQYSTPSDGGLYTQQVRGARCLCLVLCLVYAPFLVFLLRDYSK